MIPKIIHYCWFGRGKMPELAEKCIASWKKYLPEYEFKLWNEDTFDINSVPYVKEAYEAALSSACPDDFIFVGGSTFIVADLLSMRQQS